MFSRLPSEAALSVQWGANFVSKSVVLTCERSAQGDARAVKRISS